MAKYSTRKERTFAGLCYNCANIRDGESKWFCERCRRIRNLYNRARSYLQNHNRRIPRGSTVDVVIAYKKELVSKFGRKLTNIHRHEELLP